MAAQLVERIGRVPDEVDPDAIGGVALWFYEGDGRKTMVGVRNEGRSVVCVYAAGADIPEVNVSDDVAGLLAYAQRAVTRP
jgi:hypothetical protein